MVTSGCFCATPPAGPPAERGSPASSWGHSTNGTSHSRPSHPGGLGPGQRSTSAQASDDRALAATRPRADPKRRRQIRARGFTQDSLGLRPTCRCCESDRSGASPAVDRPRFVRQHLCGPGPVGRRRRTSLGQAPPHAVHLGSREQFGPWRCRPCSPVLLFELGSVTRRRPGRWRSPSR